MIFISLRQPISFPFSRTHTISLVQMLALGFERQKSVCHCWVFFCKGYKIVCQCFFSLAAYLSSEILLLLVFFFSLSPPLSLFPHYNWRAITSVSLSTAELIAFFSFDKIRVCLITKFIYLKIKYVSPVDSQIANNCLATLYVAVLIFALSLSFS